MEMEIGHEDQRLERANHFSRFQPIAQRVHQALPIHVDQATGVPLQSIRQEIPILCEGRIGQATLQDTQHRLFAHATS